MDINDPKPGLPRQIVVDASVLYFIHYPNFGSLGMAGGRTPSFYQTRAYPNWWGRALKAKTELYALPATVGEFLRACEYAELEAICLTDPSRPAGLTFDPRDCKKARYYYEAQLSAIRGRVVALAKGLQKSVRLLPQFRTEADTLDQPMAAWQASAGDFTDSLMVANARWAQVPNILADDIDLLTFDGITVYTANKTAANAASAAGKLVR